MRKLIWASIAALIAGCAEPMPDVAEAVRACLDSGGQPHYFHNGAATDFQCVIGTRP